MFKIFDVFFKEKKIVIVTDNNIKTREITKFSRFIKMLFYFWVIFTSIFFLINRRIQIIKDNKIKELKVVNSNLNNDIKKISYFLKDLNGYLYTLNYYDRFNKIDINKISGLSKNILKNNSLIGINDYKEILPVLDEMERNIANIDTLVSARINGINNLLKEVSLDKEAENIYKVSYQNTNLHIDRDIVSKSSILVNKSSLVKLKKDINYLNFLESFLNLIPIYKPINNYYISSNFGTRVDPFTKKAKLHKGIDFAGPFNSKIYAPADGIVEIVAVRGGFGNSIEINHGNNIVTEYAHLNKALVKVGDVVKRGDEIAIQGSSGRSTGQHLHWEVKVNKKNVDPIKFIRMGEKIY